MRLIIAAVVMAACAPVTSDLQQAAAVVQDPSLGENLPWYGINDLNRVNYIVDAPGAIADGAYKTAIRQAARHITTHTSLEFHEISYATVGPDLDERHIFYVEMQDTTWVSKTLSWSALKALLAGTTLTATQRTEAQAIVDTYGPDGFNWFRPAADVVDSHGNTVHRDDDMIVMFKPGIPVTETCTASVCTVPASKLHVFLHETGHALNLRHEQERSDRCDTMSLWADCQASGAGFGLIDPMQPFVVLAPYDIASVMQYSSAESCSTSTGATDAGSCTCYGMLARELGSNTRPLTADEIAAQRNNTPSGETCSEGNDNTVADMFFIKLANVLSQEDTNTLMQLEPPQLGTVAAANERFGHALAAGDFDGDGYPDLAVGAPNASDGTVTSGRVYLYRGTFTGLIPWTTLDEPGTGHTNADSFGTSLAVHIRNGIHTLVVGAPGRSNGGTVWEFTSTPADSIRSFTITRITADNAGFVASAAGDGFGTTLVTGRFGNATGGGLAIGAPAIHTVYVVTDTGGTWTKAARLGADRSASEDFGRSLAAGDIDGDGITDLVIGAPGSAGGAGRVYVARGRTGSDPFAVTQLDEPVVARDPGDAFGTSVGIAHLLPGAGRSVIVGAPGRNASGSAFVFDAGMPTATTAHVRVLAATANLDVTGAAFGSSIAVGKFDGDTLDDVVIGAPHATLFGKASAGVVAIYRNTDTGVGITIDPNEVAGASTNDRSAIDPAAVSGSRVAHERFGTAIAIGAFSTKTPQVGVADIAVGGPGRLSNSGVAWVLTGGSAADPGFATDETMHTVLVQPGLLTLYRRAPPLLAVPPPNDI